ncbi:Translation initiation factor eIF-2B subunit alpha [Liparis tanakae]|uniref:Translation initiation factor eIF-2B subunit alpha n=1 Tax=Liparis tanakae TaxID=230148 RepID=A0A4Z2EGT2_9TELE|nr:Translation initiation factor eIF-2B subunit alpha [Liparis tanakae]
MEAAGTSGSARSLDLVCVVNALRVPSELVEYFRAQMRTDPDMASAVAAIRTLLAFLRRDTGRSARVRQMADALRNLNVPVTVVLDAAVGYVLEKVDLVIVGAEGVVESGGIINKVNTCTRSL